MRAPGFAETAAWMRRHYFHFAAGVVGVGALYFAAALAGIWLARLPDSVASIWLANAIALVFFLRQPVRRWPALGAMVFLTGLLANLISGDSLSMAAGLMVANLVEIAGAAAVIVALDGVNVRLMDVFTYVRVVAVAAIGAPAVAGLLGAGVVAASAHVDFLPVYWSWWSGSAIGVLLVLPPALSLTRARAAEAFTGRALTRTLLLALFAVLVGVGAIALSTRPFIIVSLPLAAAAMLVNPLATAILSGLSIIAMVVTEAAGLGTGVPDGLAHTTIRLYAALTIIMPFGISLLIDQLRRERGRIAESEKLFRLAMENAPIGKALVSLDGAWIRVNRAVCDLLGYDEAELLSKTFAEITHPDDLEADLAFVHRVLAGEIDDYRMEKRYIRKDGSVVHTLLAVALMRDERTREPLYFISQIVDITPLKAAEEALAASESRWSFALESARQGVWDFDIRAGRTYYSPMWKAMLGLGDKEFGDTGTAWQTLVHPDDLERVVALDHEHRAGGTEEFVCEFRMRHKDGHWVWILDRGKVIERDADGAPLRMIGTHTDITDIKQAEAALAEAESRWNFALESAGQGAWEYDLAGGGAFYSATLKRILGYGPDEIANDPKLWQTLVHPEDLPRLVAAVDRLLKGADERMRIEFRMQHKDGRWIWMLDRGRVAARDGDGRPTRVIGTLTDVTKRIEAARALAEAESRWNFALDSAGQGVWDHDFRTNKAFYSPTWKAILGYEPDELANTHEMWKALVHPDDLPKVEAIDRDVIAGRVDSISCEFRMRHKDGRWIWVLDRGRILERDPAGGPLRMIGTHTDITRNKQAEEALAEAENRWSFALEGAGQGVWDHDLKTRSTYYSPTMKRIVGYAPDEIADDREVWRGMIHPDDLPRLDRAVADLLAQRRADLWVEFRMRHKDGHWIWVLDRGKVIERDADGTPRRMIGTNTDITERVRAERELSAAAERLRTEEERLRVTLNSIGDGVIATDAQGCVTFMNPRAEAETGWRESEAIGLDIGKVFRVFRESDDTPLPNPVSACVEAGGRPLSLDDVILIGRKGRKRMVRTSAALVKIAGQEPVGVVVVFQDMTRARRLQQRLAHTASHDALTGLRNRASFEEELAAACTEAADGRRQHAVCVLDLDRFKEVNDGGGHAAGDAVLREVARVMREAVRSEDIVARMGGDEFALLMRDCPLGNAKAIALKIVSAVHGLKVMHEGEAFSVGTSAGIAPIQPGSGPDAVVKEADAACYAAKAAGRGTVRVAGDPVSLEDARRAAG